MSGLSEAELHVQAMRLVCEALREREQDGLEVDWDVLRQMHDQMDAILQALQHRHRYDSSEIVDLRKERDAAKAEIETLRQQLANAKRAASDEFTERQVLTVEQQQDAAIWQQQLDAARAEIETLKGAMAADDKRLRDAEQRVWPGMTWGCDSPDKMADAILHLRKQLAEQQAETIDVRRQRNNETDRLNATNAVSVQQRDEIAYLRTRLDEERSVSAGVREKLTAAEAAVTLQRAGIERLHKFVGKARLAMWPEDLKSALTELDAGTEPTPVAERCPECDGSEMVDSGGFWPDGKGINVPCGGDCSGNPCSSQPTPVAEPVPCPECVKLRAFVGRVRELLQIPLDQIRYDDMAIMRAELAALDAEGGA